MQVLLSSHTDVVMLLDPLFMLFFMPILIFLRRDYGPMLIAERKTQVYNRQDGGDGKSSGTSHAVKANQPEDTTPPRVWNMLVPLGLLVILIIHLLVQSGEDPDVKQTLIDKLRASDSYFALLYSSMAAALLTLLFYLIQFKQDGTEILWPTPSVLGMYFRQNLNKSNIDEEQEEGVMPPIRPLMTLGESVSAFLYGMSHVFPAAIVLTLAWASGTVMNAVGTDRLFAEIITGGLAYESLPTLSFVISFLMALATGTSWGTMVRQVLITVPLLCLACS